MVLGPSAVSKVFGGRLRRLARCPQRQGRVGLAPSERSASRRRWTARAASPRASRRRCVSTASKSSWSAAPGATSRSISASIADANACAQAFLLRRCCPA